MKRKRFRVEQIVDVLKQAEMGAPVADWIHHLGIAEQTVYRWKRCDAIPESEPVREFKQRRDENIKLKRLVADWSLDKVLLQGVLAKKWEGLRRSGLWSSTWARRIRSVSGAPAGGSTMQGPVIAIAVTVIPASSSASESGR